MQPTSPENVKALLEKKFSDIEYELKTKNKPDIVSGEIIGYLEAFLMLHLISTSVFASYHRRYNALYEKFIKSP